MRGRSAKLGVSLRTPPGRHNVSSWFSYSSVNEFFFELSCEDARRGPAFLLARRLKTQRLLAVVHVGALITALEDVYLESEFVRGLNATARVEVMSPRGSATTPSTSSSLSSLARTLGEARRLIRTRPFGRPGNPGPVRLCPVGIWRDLRKRSAEKGWGGIRSASLIASRPWFIIHFLCSSIIAHRSSIAANRSLFIALCSALIVRGSSLTVHNLQFMLHCSSVVARRAPLVVNRSRFLA